jgi:protein SCO1/2
MPSSQPEPKGRRSAISNPTSRLAAVVGIVALAVLLGAVWLTRAPFSSTEPLIGGPFALVDGAGHPVTNETLRGRPFLVYFGYTHCPDTCPTELARISDVLAAMGDRAIPALFVTVDPERDTPKLMQDYVSSFDPHVTGLSGSPQAIGAAEKAFRVFARKGTAGPDGAYSMDHSSIVYLMSKAGAFVEVVNMDRPPKDIAKDLEQYL